MAFNSIVNDSRLLKAHVPTSKICLILLSNLLQIYYRFDSATIYDRAECRSRTANCYRLRELSPKPRITWTTHRSLVDVPLEAGGGLGALGGAVDADPLPDVVRVLPARDAGATSRQD